MLLLLLNTITGVAAVSSFAGVNIAGFDFGVDITGTANLRAVTPPLRSLGGKDGAGQMQHFVENDGLDVFRLPVSWQFLINNDKTAVADLDTTNFAKYDELVQACLGTGAQCIIDIHNYARFNNLIIGQGGPLDELFASFWFNVASNYANSRDIIFGIMNEPHEMPDMSVWANTVQAAVTAIRNAGATTQIILLPGDHYTSAQSFIENGSAGNLSVIRNPDGSNTSLIFDVHQYLDSDGSGTHRNCTSNLVNDTFVPLAAYLKANGRMAFLSETGGGNTTSCMTKLCEELSFINSNPDVFLGYTAWAAGSFRLSYALSLTPIEMKQEKRTLFKDQEILTQCVVNTRVAAGEDEDCCE